MLTLWRWSLQRSSKPDGLAEDVPSLENQQKGFEHPDVKQGPFHPLLEANIAGFAHWYANQMLRSLDAPQDIKKEL